MRYIDTRKLLIKRKNWSNRAELWKDPVLKKDFKEYFHNKCWYTEVPLTGQDMHIDHFRPKSKVKKFENFSYNEPLCNTGYTWLKNDVTNYRACCIHANRVTGNGGKGCFFPLKKNSPYLTKNGAENEQPLLLDPCKKEDVQLITFYGPRIDCTTENDQDKERVYASEKIYNLLDFDISEARLKVWLQVEQRINIYKNGKMDKDTCITFLRDLVSQNAPFSACAIACVNSLAPDDIKEKLALDI